MHYPYIRRCLELAENGRGKVSPNPLVGCVIVQGGSVLTEGWLAGRPAPRSPLRLCSAQTPGEVGSLGEGWLADRSLGEGWHEECGGAHAETVALRKAGDLARGATLYVNLEPCCHEGKQPPCTDAIIRSGVKTVVFGARDPENGGSEVLKLRGLGVVGPLMEAECKRLNRGFFSLIEKGRPWVTIKKAMRRDGTTTGKITNAEQDRWAHTHLRAKHDAILVGAGTVIADDPKLTVRHAASPQPRRIILDPHKKILKSSKVLTDEDAHRTMVIRGKMSIPDLLQKLKEEGISSLLVEGGPKVWQSFEESGCADEVVILTQSFLGSSLPTSSPSLLCDI